MDFILIHKVKNGDEESSETFVRKYYSQIFRYVLLHIRNYEDAEDIVQETFMKFFISLNRYKDYGKVLNYLYVIARNLCNDYYKKSSNNIRIDNISDYENILKEKNITDNDLKLDIENAVNSLPEDIKEIAILFFFQELKQKEIAKILGIKLSLVKYRVGRAKQILSEYLKEV